jgi:hypothetical protein
LPAMVTRPSGLHGQVFQRPCPANCTQIAQAVTVNTNKRETSVCLSLFPFLRCSCLCNDGVGHDGFSLHCPPPCSPSFPPDLPL